MDRILTTSNICVNEIHSLSGGDLEIVSGNKVLFNTPNLLIGNMLFDNYCTNIVFTNTLIAPDENYYKVTIGDISNRDEITNMSEYELMSVDCTQVTSKETYEKLSGENKENYINLTGENNIYIKSSNIFVNDESFHDYVYRKVNNKEIPSHNSIFVTKTAVHQGMIDTLSRVADVTNMGTFVTKKILCDKISTENIYVSGDIEPILKISSESGINFGLSSSDEYHNRIFIIEDDENIVNLDTYLKRRLDESSMFEINILAEPGVDITISYDQNIESKGFSNYYNNISEFSYDINFKIVLNGEIPDIDSEIGLYDEYHAPQIGGAINIQDDQLTENISFGNTTYSRYALSNLTAGQFYDVYADIKNNFTGTIVYNVLTNAVNVPTIEHVVINSIDIINERTLEITFIPHVTVVPSWFTQEKLVFFYLNLYDHDDSVNLYTSCNYDISSSGSRPIYTYRFDINDFNNYFDEYGLESYENIIKVEQKDPATNYENITYEMKEHIFSIVSVHGNDATSTFEMISIPVVNAPYLLGVNPNPEILIYPPTEPTNLEIKYNNIIDANDHYFEWIASSPSNFRSEIINEPTESRTTEILYEIFLNNELLTSNITNTWYDGESVLQNGSTDIDTIRNTRKGIKEGEYTLYAYNLFGKHFKERGHINYQRSIVSESKVVHPLTIDSIILTPIIGENKEWIVEYDISNSNSDFTINTNKTNLVTNTNTNITSFTIQLLNYELHNIWIQANDNLIQIRSVDIIQNIEEPFLISSVSEYVLGTERQYIYNITFDRYSFDNSINNANVNSHNNLIKDLFNFTTVTNIQNVNGLETIEKEYNSNNIDILFQVDDSYEDITTEFRISARDSYGYESINLLTNVIEVSFSNLTIKPEISGENKEFSLALGDYEFVDQFTNLKWMIGDNNVRNTTSSNISFSLSENYFGNIYCIITQTNEKGFSRNGDDNFIDKDFLRSTILSDNNVVESRFFTESSFTLIDNSEFTFTLEYADRAPDLITDLERRLVLPNGTQTNILENNEYEFKSDGDYQLELFLKNKYGFRSWVRLENIVTVSTPTVPIFTVELKPTEEYKTVSISYDTGDDTDGDPVEIPTTRRIVYSPNNGSPSSPIVLNVGINNININNLTHGTQYSITVEKVYEVYGIKSFTNQVYTNRKPAAPTLSFAFKDYTYITITYSKNHDEQEYSSGGWRNIGGPTSVMLKRSDNSQEIDIRTTSATQHTFTNLFPGTTYNFTITKTYFNSEFNISGSSGGISTKPIVDAIAPTITEGEVTVNSITLNFRENSNGSAGTNVTYKLYKNNVVINTFTSLVSNFTDNGLSSGTTYSYKLQKIIGEPYKTYGQNSPNGYIFSSTLTIQTEEPLIYPVGSITAEASSISYNSFTISWVLTITSSGSSHFVNPKYKIEWGIKDSAQSIIDNVNSSYTINSGITSSTQYTATITYYYTNGHEIVSNQLDITTIRDQRGLNDDYAYWRALDLRQLSLGDAFYVKFRDVEHNWENMVNGTLPLCCWDMPGSSSEMSYKFHLEDTSNSRRLVNTYGGWIYVGSTTTYPRHYRTGTISPGDPNYNNGFYWHSDNKCRKVLEIFFWTWDTSIEILDVNGAVLYEFSQEYVSDLHDTVMNNFVVDWSIGPSGGYAYDGFLYSAAYQGAPVYRLNNPYFIKQVFPEMTDDELWANRIMYRPLDYHPLSWGNRRIYYYVLTLRNA